MRIPLIFFSLPLLFGCGGTYSEMEGFEVLPVDEHLQQSMEAENVFGEHSPVPMDRLRLVKVKYHGFDDQTHDGKLVVLDACSEQVKGIFMELFLRKFAIESINPITAYGGSDSLSMAANNTSAHNLRPITGGERFSLHAYGTAIDLNPVQNPYVAITCDDSLGVAYFQPVEGIAYANRNEIRLGKEMRKGMAESVVDVFASHGFYWWGGYWDCPIDYQHFQLSRSLTELLVAMDSKEATRFFDRAVAFYNAHEQPFETVLKIRVGENVSLAEAYKADPKAFMELVENLD